MGQPGQQSHLFAAMGGAVVRHVGAFVPAEDAGAGAKNGGVLDAAEEFGVCVMQIHDARTPTDKSNAPTQGFSKPSLAFQERAEKESFVWLRRPQC